MREAQESRFERLIRLRKMIHQELIDLAIELQEWDNDIDYAKHIINRTSKFTGIPKNQLLNCTRKREVLDARRMAIAIIRRNTKLSLAKIGALFGKDHATILHAERTAKDIYKFNKEYRRRFDELLLYVNSKKLTKR